jgi:hypothetical protein
LIVITFITFLYVAFGVSGYLVSHLIHSISLHKQLTVQSFGAATSDIITLNLPPPTNGIDAAMLVKLCLCLALFLTYPGAYARHSTRFTPIDARLPVLQ